MLPLPRFTPVTTTRQVSNYALNNIHAATHRSTRDHSISINLADRALRMDVCLRCVTLRSVTHYCLSLEQCKRTQVLVAYTVASCITF